jgi:uncharacterized protein (DUF433 family)
MSFQLSDHPHVGTNDQILHGEPIVMGTRTPVRAIVETWQLGVPPEEILVGMPHLTLAQVVDALRYYQDHPAEIDACIAANRIPDSLLHPAVREHSNDQRQNY